MLKPLLIFLKIQVLLVRNVLLGSSSNGENTVDVDHDQTFSQNFVQHSFMLNQVKKINFYEIIFMLFFDGAPKCVITSCYLVRYLRREHPKMLKIKTITKSDFII